MLKCKNLKKMKMFNKIYVSTENKKITKVFDHVKDINIIKRQIIYLTILLEQEMLWCTQLKISKELKLEKYTVFMQHLFF